MRSGWWRVVAQVLVTGVVLAALVRAVQPDDREAEPTPPPPSSRWPTTATTGATTPEADLTPSTNCSIEAGVVVEGVVLTCPNGLGVGDGATLRDAVVRSDALVGIKIMGDGATAVVEDVTITRTTACLPGIGLGSAGYHAERVTVSGFTEAFRVDGGDVEIRDSYAKVCSVGGAHTNGLVGHSAGDDVVFAHNTVDGRCPAEEACLTDALVAWADGGDRLSVVDNLFRGGGYTISIGGGAGHTVRGNLVERGSYVFGPVDGCVGVTTWTDNHEAALTSAAEPSHEKTLDCPTG